MAENLEKFSAEELRAKASAARQSAQDSFDRCDTDGFLSQWASGLSAQQYDREAALREQGGQSEFWGLYRGDQRVRAKMVTVPAYRRPWDTVERWMVVNGEGRAVAWFPVNYGRGRSRKLKAAGLEERRELAPAKAKIVGVGTGLSGRAWVATVRTDGGYPAGAVDL